MSASRTICSRCAPHISLATTVTAGRPSIAAVARFSSAAEAHPASAAVVKKEDYAARPPRYASAKAGRLGQPPRPLVKKDQSKRKKRGEAKYEAALALFNDIVSHKGEAGSAEASTTASSGAGLADWEIAGKLGELLKLELHAAKLYSVFCENIWPFIRDHPRPLPKHLYTLTTHALSDLCKGVAKENFVYHHECMEIVKMYNALGKWNLGMINELIVALCFAIAREKNAPKREELTAELVDIWKAVSQMRRPSQRNKPLQFTLPKPDEVRRDINKFHGRRRRFEEDDTTRAVSSIFLQFDPLESNALTQGILATTAVLTDTNLVPEAKLVDAAPLLEVLQIALPHADTSSDYIERLFGSERRPSTKMDILRKHIQKQWPTAMATLENPQAAWRAGLRKPADPNTAATKTLAHFHRQLRAAHRTNNIGAITSIWQDLQTALRERHGLKAQLHDDPEFLDFWHFVWCAVRQPAMLKETQALMHDVGLKATVRTYTAMMYGWRLGRDHGRINALWEMLLQSGMPLDKHIWTERISGLIETGKLQKGLETLAAMMKQWEEAPTNARGHAVQPTIEVVNAAFKGIIRRDRKAALEVLEWAGGHGIKPDVRTYNILIRESFQSEDGNDDVQGLLRSMKERGIAADEATFTIILEEVLGGLGPAPAAEQVSAVHMVMDDIKAAGLQPNAETYGKMLHAVASLPNGADEAIEAVQEHMRADGHAQISPHMALILLGRAQRANPHDSGPVRALLARHGFNSIRTGDQRLWEHVLSAYATAGDASRALALHDEMREAGRPATWQFCLRDLLTCLIEKGMLDEARRVVDGALADVVARAADGVVPARTWRHHFWHLASAHGLLDNTVVPPELRNVLEDGWVVGEPQ